MPSQVIRSHSVEPQVYDRFRGAGSRGRFFAYEIRNRYRYRRIETG
jgi:hypothetical protein